MGKLPHYSAKRVRRNGKMLYQIEGNCYPGVTSVLSATKPAEAREALQRWRQRVGNEEARRISGRASSAGTRLHQQIAAYLNDESIDIAPELTGYWASIEPVLSQVEQVLLVEGAVWHQRGFVGFPDALVVFDGEVHICDWKTALRPKRKDWIGDYFLQIAAYREAVRQVYQEYEINVTRGLVAIALDHQPAQLFNLSLQDLNHHWTTFQGRLLEYETRRRLASKSL